MSDTNVIYAYTLEQAIADGELIEIFKNRWQELSEGKPIVATRAIHAAYSLAAMQEIWNEFVVWLRDIMPTLPEEDQLFSTSMNDSAVWVLEDGAAFTILFPEDY
jgi:hypothetical protein